MDDLIYPLKAAAVGTAILCGFIIGIERQLSGKAAGIRTSILICMGAYFFTAISGVISAEADPAKVIGQIVTGIGFIGAGVIIGREGIVLGVTTAAVIWVLAAIGIIIGLEKYLAAILVSVLTVTLLTGVTVLENIFNSLQRGVHKRLTREKKKYNHDKTAKQL